MIPILALFNAGIPLQVGTLADSVGHPVGLGNIGFTMWILIAELGYADESE